jgi:hypothetical protein
MVMFVYGIDADAAFDVLRKQSQQTTSNSASSPNRY